jgi:hypothetical protein
MATDNPQKVRGEDVRHSFPAMYAKVPPTYSQLSTTSRTLVDRIDPKRVRPSELKELADALERDHAISLSQKSELDMIRKPYADQSSDDAFDFVVAMEMSAAFAADFERQIPGSGCAAYYKGMLRFAEWLDSTSSLHRRGPILSRWA